MGQHYRQTKPNRLAAWIESVCQPKQYTPPAPLHRDTTCVHCDDPEGANEPWLGDRLCRPCRKAAIRRRNHGR